MQVAVDLGGTFTDPLVRDGAGGIRATKVPTTQENQARGIMDVLRRLAVEPAALDDFVHGTTIALITLLERRGCPGSVAHLRSGFRAMAAPAPECRYAR